MPIITLPKTLRDKLGEEASESLVELFNSYGKENKDSVIDMVEERFKRTVISEISGLREEMKEGERSLSEEMRAGDAALREQMQAGDAALREQMQAGDAALREEIRKVDSDLREQIISTDASLRSEIHKSKADTIKWMFIFWIGQIGAILGILFAFFK